MKTYIYIGGGDGIPCLPHEVSDAEAEKLGVTALLQEAISSGAYIEKHATAVVSKRSTKQSSAETDKE